MHDKIADNGMQFALSLHQMHEDLNELANNMERGRKQWKAQGLEAEKRVQVAEADMEKAKSKYNRLAEDYDRVRTGDGTAGRRFGIKGPKSASQHEEDLSRKVQTADSDYQTRVQEAQRARKELLDTLRPQAIRELSTLIHECDSALTLQLQKFGKLGKCSLDVYSYTDLSQLRLMKSYCSATASSLARSISQMAPDLIV